MYAIVESGGKQYRVSEGEMLQVELLPNEVGDEVELERVLLVSDGSKVTIGQPLVEGARVVTQVEAIEKGDKIRVWKYRPKNRYRRRKGHRQTYTHLRVKEIVA
jgi:large subunit ribosomal protein L21